MKVTLCTACGYNMIGKQLTACPFCGAAASHFLAADEASRRFHIQRTTVNDKVTRLDSRPRLGLEHAAYEVATDDGPTWIDCPAVFDPRLAPPKRTLFTHKDFLGASPLYRDVHGTALWLNAADASLAIAAHHPIDERPAGDFMAAGISGWHIPGHSPGYTVYVFGNTLFAGDLVFFRSANMRVNPFGKAGREIDAARHLQERLGSKDFAVVCGWNYVAPYARWRAAFDAMLAGGVRHHAPTVSHVCRSCGYLYDPAEGDIEGGITPGTSFDDLPEDWVCPDCGLAKAELKPLHSLHAA